jgi:hypothetical protein
MIKNFLLLFCLLFSLFFKTFFNSGPTITTSIPAIIKAGSEFIVEIEINKGNIEGFAKLQQELPEGYTATAIENKGASFTFSEQKVKFIWISLPSEEKFTLSYKVKCDGNIGETKQISGSFNYLFENDKKVYQIPPVTVNYNGQEPIISNLTANNSQEKGIPTETLPVTTINEDLFSEVNCSRNIDYSAVPSGEFTVEITIKKDDLTGFAKLQETLPRGLTATAIETKNASFTFSDQKVKFVWMSLPPQKEFKVSYRVKVSADTKGTLFFNGEFSYLEKDGETRKCILPQDAVNIDPSASEPLAEQPKKQEPKVTPKQAPANKEPIKPSTGIPAPQPSGVVYRVQIAAGPNVVGQPYFHKKYGFKEPVYVELHQGLNKYTTGGFEIYKSARDNRENINANYPFDTGPFVTAYNNGQRITVQEALMITNQQWVK